MGCWRCPHHMDLNSGLRHMSALPCPFHPFSRRSCPLCQAPPTPKKVAPRVPSRHRVFIDNTEQEVWWSLPLSRKNEALGWEGGRRQLPGSLPVDLSRILELGSASWITLQVNLFLLSQSARLTSRRLKTKKVLELLVSRGGVVV